MSARNSALRKGAVVQIPRAEYEEILKRVQDLEDALIVLNAERDDRPEAYLPGALMKRLIAGEHALRVWRDHRGLTVAALATRSGVGASYISEIETGKKPGSVAALKKLATALAVDLDDLVK